MGSVGKTENNLNTESGMARELFNKPWAELTEEQKNQVTDAVIKHKAESNVIDATDRFKKNELKGEVSFKTIIRASENKVSFDKFNTATLNHRIYQTSKKDIGRVLQESGVTEFLGNMYRDKSGANDLKRIQDAGFEIVAYHRGESTGSVPPRDFYYFKKKGSK